MSKSYHLCIDVRGVIRNWKDKELVNLFRGDKGEKLTAAQIKDELIQHIAQGHDVIPAAKCDNFDWKKGCQGHEEQP